MRILRIALRWLLRVAAVLVFIVIFYLAAAWLTAGVPRHITSAPLQSGGEREVLLIQTLLHVDIAVPYDSALLAKFPELENTDLPLDDPNLQYVAFGWGSKAFYTTAGQYSDIRPAAVIRAVTGDDAVMRVVAMGYLNPDADDVATLSLSVEAYDSLLASIKNSFTTAPSSVALPLSGLSIGPFDAFFAAKGHFNIINPCNQWVADVLHDAGVPVGRWTPTTYSLMHSLEELSPSNFQR
ncbi:TIGR02117 family protein [Ahrensia sp. R2A130]|uniref:TIGR02117 family protein n=1 Tax=Ahrensia sp. R2A130 TaxID=744979 RepID=UPI000311049A|nr:TIGR02117 family protein [Ahrensia sp. R2A130]